MPLLPVVTYCSFGHRPNAIFKCVNTVLVQWIEKRQFAARGFQISMYHYTKRNELHNYDTVMNIEGK